MRALDVSLRVWTGLVAIGALFLPTRTALGLYLSLFIALGLWALIFPPGVLGWARSAIPDIDPYDHAVWWVPRIIGAGFIAMAVFTTVELWIVR